MSPLLSVVIPTHDRADMVGRAVQSVLDQNVDLEVVVVDDGSTDTTSAELDRLADSDSRVRIVTSGTPVSLGPSGARNIGIEVARGDLLSFCDDDDAWLPGVAAACVGYLLERPGSVAVSSWHTTADLSGRTRAFRGPRRISAEQFLWRNFIATPFAVIRRSRVAFPNWFDSSLRTCEDWDLWLRCAELGDIEVLPRSGYSYLQHGGQRVTGAQSNKVMGLRAFVSKYAQTMSPACRLYHDAVLAGLSEGRQAMVQCLRNRRHAPYVAMLLGLSWGASQLGQRIGDPGLSARLLAAAVLKDPSRRDQRDHG